jgi:F-type H+-transporting ATPase subunit b
MVVLSKKVWGPVLKALDERDQAIREDLDKAKKAKEDADKVMEEQKQAMIELREESKKIRDEAIQLAEKQKKEMLIVAKQEAEQVMAKAREEMLREKEAMLEDFKNLAVDVGVELARKLIAKELDASAHSEILKASMQELEDAYKRAG